MTPLTKEQYIARLDEIAAAGLPPAEEFTLNLMAIFGRYLAELAEEKS